MILEHVFYSAAIALLSVTIYHRITAKNGWHYAAIIMASAFSPDIIKIVMKGLFFLSIQFCAIPFYKLLVLMDAFSHTIAAVVVYALLVALLLLILNWRFSLSFIFASIGYGTHLFSDSLVYREGYPYFWPISSIKTGIGIFNPYTTDFFGIANTLVLVLGLIVVIGTAILCITLEGSEWRQQIPYLKK